MTKKELTQRVAQQTGFSQEVVLAVVEETMHTIKDTMANGESIFLRGFGTFGFKERKEKVARNISKNTSIVVPAHKIPFFRPCPEFKDSIK